jgi:hypothetical protein
MNCYLLCSNGRGTPGIPIVGGLRLFVSRDSGHNRIDPDKSRAAREGSGTGTVKSGYLDGLRRAGRGDQKVRIPGRARCFSGVWNVNAAHHRRGGLSRLQSCDGRNRGPGLDPTEARELALCYRDRIACSVQSGDPRVARNGASGLAAVFESKDLIHVSGTRTTAQGGYLDLSGPAHRRVAREWLRTHGTCCRRVCRRRAPGIEAEYGDRDSGDHQHDHHHDGKQSTPVAAPSLLDDQLFTGGRHRAACCSNIVVVRRAHRHAKILVYLVLSVHGHQSGRGPTRLLAGSGRTAT